MSNFEKNFFFFFFNTKDGISVISVTYSLCLVYKITIIRTFDTKAMQVHGWGVIMDEF